MIPLQVKKDNQSSIFIAQSGLKRNANKAYISIYLEVTTTHLCNPEIAAGGQDKTGKIRNN